MTPFPAAEFAAQARAYVGTRYQHQGRLPGVGLDCAGVALCAARAVGYNVADVVGYSMLPDGDTLTRAVGRYCARVPTLDAIEVGDIILFAWDEEPQHVAVVSAMSPYPTIVHAHSYARRVVEHILDETWLARARVVYRFGALEEI